MLDKKTLYAIYLLHRASNLYTHIPYPKMKCMNNLSVEKVRLQSYLSGSGRITRNLDNKSLISFLNDLGEIINPLPVSEEEKACFPRTLAQFNHSYELWSSGIQ